MKLDPDHEWIPAEPLPDCDTTFLVAVRDGNEPVWLGYHDGETWRNVTGERIDVSHWRNLPDPPE